MSPIDLVPIYFSEHDSLVARLGGQIRETFHVTVRTRAPWFDPELSFDSSRGQYNSTLLLRQLLNAPGEGSLKVLGLTSVDLFIPVLTFVFGEAQLGGRASVVSTHRLRTAVYGLAPDPERLNTRLLTEALHELGHTFGLLHCLEQTCAMHASTYVEEIDLKEADFCAACLAKLRVSRNVAA